LDSDVVTKIVFPHPNLADEQGLLAIGGDLSVETLLTAYQQGCFPWYSEGEPILWWSPDPRMVLLADDFHCSKRLARRLKQECYHFSYDQDFAKVIQQCEQVHAENDGTWLLPEMQQAYIKLHEQGYAHSVEVWRDGVLIGGVYGVLLKQVFFAESMFSIQRDASKMSLAQLVERAKAESWQCIDCQFHTKHLQSLGAKEVSRQVFLERFLQL